MVLFFPKQEVVVSNGGGDEMEWEVKLLAIHLCGVSQSLVLLLILLDICKKVLGVIIY